MMDNDLTNVIFLGTVNAGFPSPGEEWREQPLNLHDLVVEHALSTYFMQVQGDSMTGACLYPNDVIVVDRALTATHNKIVVARLGDAFTLKRLWMMRPKMYLRPEKRLSPEKGAWCREIVVVGKRAKIAYKYFVHPTCP